MTVYELMQKLEHFDPELKVVVRTMIWGEVEWEEPNDFYVNSYGELEIG